MKRLALIVVAVAAIATVVTFAVRRPGGTPVASSDEIAETKRDSVWYHASDVALLATTGRPQLLEFFHPN